MNEYAESTIASGSFCYLRNYYVCVPIDVPNPDRDTAGVTSTVGRAGWDWRGSRETTMASVPQESYAETREDIEDSLGMVPGYFEALNEPDLVNEWPVFKRFALEETEIPAKYRELIGLAIAANIKCPYCQTFHTEAAKLHGATEAELAEISLLASYTTRYSALIHAQNYDLETFEQEVEEIGAHLQEHMGSD